jgi:hypothetical protein
MKINNYGLNIGSLKGAEGIQYNIIQYKYRIKIKVKEKDKANKH